MQRLLLCGTVLMAVGLSSPLAAQPASPTAAPKPALVATPQPTDATPTTTATAAAAPASAKVPSLGPRAAAGEDQMMRYPPSSVRLGLILGGTAVVAAAYGLGAMTSQIWDEVPGSQALLIPVAGPWIALAQNDCSPELPDCTTSVDVRGVLLVIDGIAQLGGLALIGEGLFMTTEAEDPSPKTPKKTSWMITPAVGPTRVGLSISGTF